MPVIQHLIFFNIVNISVKKKVYLINKRIRAHSFLLLIMYNQKIKNDKHLTIYFISRWIYNYNVFHTFLIMYSIK